MGKRKQVATVAEQERDDPAAAVVIDGEWLDRAAWSAGHTAFQQLVDCVKGQPETIRKHLTETFKNAALLIVIDAFAANYDDLNDVFGGDICSSFEFGFAEGWGDAATEWERDRRSENRKDWDEFEVWKRGRDAQRRKDLQVQHEQRMAEAKRARNAATTE